MASENARHDADQRSVLLGITDADERRMARVDSVTGEVLIYPSGSPGLAPSAVLNARHDATQRPTLVAWNDTTGRLEALRILTDGSVLAVMV